MVLEGKHRSDAGCLMYEYDVEAGKGLKLKE